MPQGVQAAAPAVWSGGTTRGRSTAGPQGPRGRRTTHSSAARSPSCPTGS